MSEVINKVELQGVVKWEPKVFEPREEGQKLIVIFAVEVAKPKTDKTSVFNCKAFGKLAEEIRDEKLAQGDVVLVKGMLNENNWKDKSDVWHKQIEVWPSTVEFVERGDGGGDGDFVAAPAADDDDIPF